MKLVSTALFVLFVTLALGGCAQQKPQNGQGINNGGIGAPMAVIGGNGMMSIESVAVGDTVKVEYIGKFTDGNVFDKSEGRGPLEFVAGVGQMIKGFDEAIIGMKLGEEKTITLPPEKAYGPDVGQKITIQKSQIGGEGELVVGGKLYTAQGQEMTIAEIDGNNVTLEFKHPMAGKTLIFWIKVVDISKASG